jgi:hypothetical protein
VAFLGCAAVTLPSTLQFVWRERTAEPRRLAPAVVRALAALQRETRPGDVVLVKPERQRQPPPPIVIGRRVPFTRFIPFFAQLAPRTSLVERYRRTAEFFGTTDPAAARELARELQASTVFLVGADDVLFPKRGVLELLYEEQGASVYRIIPAPPLPRR